MKKTMNWFAAVTTGAVLTGCVLWSGPARADNAGEATYKAKCVGCHGADGKASTPAGKALGARDFASPEVQKQTDEQLIEIVTKGKNKMPAYGSGLKEPQIKDLVAYIRGLAKKN